jgi:hypothetical protein
MLPGLLELLLLSVTYVMGADEEESRSLLVWAMVASETWLALGNLEFHRPVR